VPASGRLPAYRAGLQSRALWARAGPGSGPGGAKAGDKKPSWNFSYHDSHIYRALQRGPTAGQVVDRTKLAGR